MVGVSSVVGGVIGVFLGLAVARDGYNKMKTAAQSRDYEGTLHHGLWCAVGANYAGISGLLGANGVMSLNHMTPPAAITPAFAYGAVGMYGALFAHGVHGLWHTRNFASNFKSEWNKSPKEALKWLAKQIA